MRIKTDERRQAIVTIAADVFREHGFERASMSMIAARLGGSKTTLYSYFKSKDELFAAAISEALEDAGEPIIDLLVQSDREPQAALEAFGRSYLGVVTQPDMRAVARTAVSEGAKESLGVMFYECGPLRAIEAIAEYLGRLVAEEKLPPMPTKIAAIHLKALLDAGFVEPLQFGARPLMEVEEAVIAAVKVFLAAYGPKE